MSRWSVKQSPIARLALVTCAAALIGGCGWTARDEFYRSRSLVLAPSDGDGSQTTLRHDGPGIPQLATPQVAQSPASRLDAESHQ
jgi:hypothetical protein